MARDLSVVMRSRGWGVHDLARASGVPATTVFSIVGKRKSMPSITNCQKIAKGLGVSLDFIWGDEHTIDIDNANIVKCELLRSLRKDIETMPFEKVLKKIDKKILEYGGICNG